MKTIVALLISLIAGNCAYAQTEHEWKVTLRVVDESGDPIPGAKASVGYFANSQPASIDGLTDSNGIFVASRHAYSGELGFSAEKADYYTTIKTAYDLGDPYNYAKWNPNPILVLKKIGMPIPMYAKKERIEIPEINKPIGFDLIEADWVAPFGKGKKSDFIFQAQRRWVSRHDFDCSLKIVFPNLRDGLVPISIPLDQGSKLRMSATAPADGYMPEISRSLSHTPANGWKDDERENNKEMNYYLRVRTALAGQGNVTSALYGKIYEDFALDPINSKTLKIFFTYYLNPAPNDRNVEFDPKQNCFKNLKPLEGVSAP